MILEMPASPFLSYGILTSRGASVTAQFVSEQTQQSRRQLQGSFVLGQGGQAAFDQLYLSYQACKETDWDGYGAVPVSENTYILACQLLEALPLGTPLPSFGAEPDGHLTMEWYRSPRYKLSVSVNPTGNLHYAALLGAGTAYGTEPFWGEAPREIVALIHRVMSE